jgi:sarcosine oxidase
MNRFDAIVLGLGAVGSATLYQLSKRGANVLGIDRYSPPHAYGSTHGDTRVTRLAIGEGAHYTPLAQRSHQIWRELETATGAELLTENGGLIMSSGSDEKSFHGAAFFATTVEAARRHAIAHELLDAAEIRRRFSQFAIADHTRGYFEPSAGFVRPEACIRAQLAQAKQFGASIQLDDAVQSIEQSGNEVHVTTARGRYSADRLVVAAGPWLPELLPELARYFKVYRQVLYWFDVEAHFADFTPDRFPIFIWELPEDGAGIYGFPAIDGPKGGFKISTEHYLETTSPGTMAREVESEEIAAMYRELVAPHIKGASARCVKAITCLYTVTRDFGFVIDRHPQHDRIIVASPCSGHGFKHSAALGEAISDLAVGQPSRFDLGTFTLARLQHQR